MTLKTAGMLVALFAAWGLQAQEAAPAKASSLEKSLTIGATLTDGNSETMLANGSFLLSGEKPKLGSFKVGIEGNYGENTKRVIVQNEDGSTTETRTDDITVNNAKIFVNVKKTLSPMTFVAVDGSVLNDGVAEVEYRAMVGPGLGLYLIKNAKTTLSLEAGVAQIWEEVQDVRDDYLALRVVETFERKFANASRIWQSAEFLPEASDFGRFLLNAEVGVEAPLQGRLNLRLVLQDKYNSEPGADYEKNDLTVIAGINIKL